MSTRTQILLICFMLAFSKTKILTKPLSMEITGDCSIEEATFFFSQKRLTTPPEPYTSNPYNDTSEDYQERVKKYLKNMPGVCAIRYSDSSKMDYKLQDFETKAQAEAQGFTVTHFGRCGACSSLQDLSVYLSNDLTHKIRKCALKSVWSIKAARRCIARVGFTPKCADIWLFNSVFTRQKCFYVCIWSYIRGEPNNRPDGTLNKCLQCDEDLSGPVFKYESGRSRRNSGIKSEINRPGEQLRTLDQCYF